MNILFFANTDWYLYNFRLSLAQRLQEQGHPVVLVSPKGAYSSRLQKMGFSWIDFNLNRRGLNPILKGITILRLARLYWRERPDMVHHFTIKCVLYGSLVSHLLGIKPVVNSVTGLGVGREGFCQALFVRFAQDALDTLERLYQQLQAAG